MINKIQSYPYPEPKDQLLETIEERKKNLSELKIAHNTLKYFDSPHYHESVLKEESKYPVYNNDLSSKSKEPTMKVKNPNTIVFIIDQNRKQRKMKKMNSK